MVEPKVPHTKTTYDNPPVIFIFNGTSKKYLHNLVVVVVVVGAVVAVVVVGPLVSGWNEKLHPYALRPALPPHKKKNIHQPQREEVEFQVPKSNGSSKHGHCVGGLEPCSAAWLPEKCVCRLGCLACVNPKNYKCLEIGTR